MKSKLKLSKNFIDGVINELSVMCYQADFFAIASEGVNLQNGFVSISRSGSVEIIDHSPDHRQRFCLGFNFIPELSTEFRDCWINCLKDVLGNSMTSMVVDLEIYGAAIRIATKKYNQKLLFFMVNQQRMVNPAFRKPFENCFLKMPM